MKIVISESGFFRLSAEAIKAYFKRKGMECYLYESHTAPGGVTYFERLNLNSYPYITIMTRDMGQRFMSRPEDALFTISLRDISRNDPDLIAVVEALGRRCDVGYSSARVVEIPDGVSYEIEMNDSGQEYISETHRTWS